MLRCGNQDRVHVDIRADVYTVSFLYRHRSYGLGDAYGGIAVEYVMEEDQRSWFIGLPFGSVSQG